MRNNLSQLISLNKIEEKLYRPADAYEQSRVTRMEHVNTTIVEKIQEGIATVAARIATLIKRREANEQKTVLSLASGRSMRDLFVELVRLHKEEGLSFKSVVVFGSYEFYPLADSSLGSMGQIKSQFLDYVDILPENIHTFPGDLPKETVFDFCEEYEKAIIEAGGIDIQVLGIGQWGNIAMNEPGTQPNSSTRLVIMDDNSRVDAKSLFGNVTLVPNCAITLGIDTILQAKEVILLAFGQHKA
ncbi:MAG: 6-phosphogluconolactonase, partial [Kiritimatiellae bacterium]|nr:6-phosphogluconolactonase [Kiritimatiellia bacterium]